jgi:hypothetical protein
LLWTDERRTDAALQWQPEVELLFLAFPEIGGYCRELFQGSLQVVGYLFGDEIGVFEVG